MDVFIPKAISNLFKKQIIHPFKSPMAYAPNQSRVNAAVQKTDWNHIPRWLPRRADFSTDYNIPKNHIYAPVRAIRNVSVLLRSASHIAVIREIIASSS